jgi:hypothetical protein
VKRTALALSRLWLLGLLVAPALVRCGGDEGASAAQCEGWSRQASVGRREAQDEAGRVCSTDADCTIVDYGLRCFADCGYPSAVASSAVSALEATIGRIDEANCTPFEAAACSGPIIPPCVPPIGTPSAVCRNGECAIELTP